MGKVPQTKITKAQVDAAIIASLIAAVTAFIAHSRWSYDYYVLFRWIICGSSLYTGYVMRAKPLVVAFCVGVGLAFNPIVPLRMRSYEWQRYDIAAAMIMGIVAAYACRLKVSARSLQ